MTWTDYWKTVFCWPQEGVPQPWGLPYWFPFWSACDICFITKNLLNVSVLFGLTGAVNPIHLGLLIGSVLGYGVTRVLWHLHHEEII